MKYKGAKMTHGSSVITSQEWRSVPLGSEVGVSLRRKSIRVSREGGMAGCKIQEGGVYANANAIFAREVITITPRHGRDLQRLLFERRSPAQQEASVFARHFHEMGSQADNSRRGPVPSPC